MIIIDHDPQNKINIHKFKYIIEEIKKLERRDSSPYNRIPIVKSEGSHRNTE